MKNFLAQKNRGFTLVETLVAISIFTVSLIALMGVLSRGVSNTSYAQRAQTATYLAQEGIEYMRNMRDTYMLYDSGGAATGWTDFNGKLTAASCQLSNGCYFNPNNLFTFPQPMMMTQVPVFPCSLAQCADHPMLYNQSNGSYGYSGVTSNYTRQINISQIGSPVNETKVSSTVYWMQGTVNFHVTLSENLFNWIE